METRQLAAQVNAAPGSRVVRFVASTAAEDRHRSRVMPAGMRAENYLKNPVVVWNHRKDSRDPDDVIGRAVSLDNDGERIVVTVEFEAGNSKADRILEKVRAGYLNSVSIGFVTTRSHSEGDVQVIDEWDLCEISVVIVGSNPEALALRSVSSRRTMTEEMYKKLGLEASAPKEEMAKALRAYLASTKDSPTERAAVCKAVDELDADNGQTKGEGSDKPAEDKPEEKPSAEDKHEEKPVAKDESPERAATEMLASQVKQLNARIAELEKRGAGKTPEQHADAAIKAGRWASSQRAKLVELYSRGLGDKAIAGIPPGTFRAVEGRTFEGGNPAAERSAPDFGHESHDKNKHDAFVLDLLKREGVKLSETDYFAARGKAS